MNENIDKFFLHIHTSKLVSQIKALNFYWITAFLVVFISLLVKFPTLGLHAEIWADNGSNFLQNALTKDFIHNITALDDAGYLPILPRIITVIVVKVFHLTKFFPGIVGAVSFLFISFFASFINARTLRPIIESDFVRFLVSIAIGLIGDYQINGLLNFTYFGVYFIFLIIFIKKARLSKLEFYAGLALTVLLICSKAFFLVFLPIFIGFFIYYRWLAPTLKNEQTFYFWGVIALFVQAVISAIFSQQWTGSAKFSVTTSISTKIWEVLNSFVVSISTILFGNETLIYGYLALSFFCIFLGGLLYLTYQLWKAKQTHLLVFVLTSTTLTVLSLALTVTTIPFTSVTDFSVSGFQTLPLIRWYIFPLFFCLLTVIVLLSHYIKNRAALIIVTVIVLARFSLVSFVAYQENVDNIPLTPQTSVSQWGAYKGLLTYPDYCIPINPAPTLIKKGCDILPTTKQSIGPVSIVDLKKMLAFSQIGTVQIRAIALAQPNIFQEKLTIIATKNGQEVGRADELTATDNLRTYFLFTAKVDADALSFVNSANEPVYVVPNITLYGSGTNHIFTQPIGGPETQSSEISNKNTFTQTLVPELNNLSGISLRFKSDMLPNNSAINIVLRDSATESVVISKTILKSDIPDDRYLTIDLPELIKNSYNRSYELIISSSNATTGTWLWLTGTTVPGTKLEINNKTLPATGIAYQLFYVVK